MSVRPQICPQIVFILDMYITHHSGKTPIDFGIQRSVVKVVGEDSLCLPTDSYLDALEGLSICAGPLLSVVLLR